MASAAALLGGGLLVPQSALAIEVQAAAHYTAEYTSNTLRTDTDEIGEWVHVPGADISVAENTAALAMDVDYSYEHRLYTEDIWTDEDILTGLAAIEWRAIPDRMDFFVNNTRTLSTVRALQTATQDNRQTISTTEAGGRLLLQPRSADEFQIEYLFRDVHTTETSTDSQRHNGTLRYLLGLSENRTLVASGTYSDIEYEGFFPNGEYAVATIGYLQDSGAVELEINVGYNWYKREGRGDTDDPMFAGSITWEARPSTTFSLIGSRMITDAGSALSSGDSASENTGINAAFEETIGTLTYTQNFGANTFTLAGYYTQQEYAEDIPLSSTVVGGRLEYRRGLTRNTTLMASADLSNGDFRDRDDQDELRAEFRVEHRLGRSLNLNWGVRYEQREAQTTESYDDWIGSIQIYWTFWGAQHTSGS